jgi:hypothetical protein
MTETAEVLIDGTEGLQEPQESTVYEGHQGDRSDHPLICDTAILPTKALEDFINTVRLWLDNLLPGSIVYGLSRVGKTQAIRYLIDNVERLLGSPIPITLMSCWEYTYQGTTENRFFSEMLHMLGYELANSGTAAVKRRRTIDFMVERAHQVQEHRYLLLVDEAQWLSEAHYRFLMDMHNQLKMSDVRLVVILVGEPELVEIRESLKSAKKRHLLGRFMTDVHRFCGLSGHLDLRRMLQALDVGSEYPIGSGISFTKFFLPKAYNAGWRFAPQAERIWDALGRICRKEHIPLPKELPIQPFTACIRWMMKTLPHMDESNLEIDERLIEEAIYRVALLQIQDYAMLGDTEGGKRNKNP